MTQEEVFAGLKEVLAVVKPSADLNAVTPGSLLLEEVGLDSLTMLLMSLGVENKFNIRLDDGVMPKTVQDVIDRVFAAVSKA